MGLAQARLQQLDRRLVTMQNALAEQVPAQRLHERFELHAALADPAGHAGWRDMHAAAAIDFLLSIERQMVVVFGDDDLRQQARSPAKGLLRSPLGCPCR